MPKQFYLILHDIRSAYNVGAIFRTADGAGVSRIYLTGYTPQPASEDKAYLTQAEKMIAKTALGAEKTVAWEHESDIQVLLEKLKTDGVQIIALEKTDKADDIFDFKPSEKAALVLGNEVEGVSSSTLARCDAVVAIPMRGKKESLNVSVAAGIAMYALLR